MDTDKIVELVTAEVMRKLRMEPLSSKDEGQTPNKKALVVFTGGSIGLEEGFRQLQIIKGLQVEMNVVLSVAAEQIIGIERVREQLGSEVTCITTQSLYPSRLLREADFILVPVLTQNTAAKLAYTLADTLASTVIMQGLLQGKPVLAAMNAADPQDSWRIEKNMGKASPTLSEALRQNLKKIAGYGIQLMPVNELAAQSQTMIQQLAKKSYASQQQSSAASHGKKSIVDAAAIEVAVSNGLREIVIPNNTIVTPLARDVAREHGIRMIQE